MSVCICPRFDLTVWPGGSAAAGSALGLAARSSCRWGANQRYTQSHHSTADHYTAARAAAGPLRRRQGGGSSYLPSGRLHSPAVPSQRTRGLRCLKRNSTNGHLACCVSKKREKNKKTSPQRVSIKGENSLWQGVELLLDQPFNLILLAVVSATEGLHPVRQLRSHLACVKQLDWMSKGKTWARQSAGARRVR